MPRWHSSDSLNIGSWPSFVIIPYVTPILKISLTMVNLPTNCAISGTLRSRLMGEHLSDASCDLATLIFDLGGQGACCWCGSSVFMLRLCTKFEVRRPSHSENIGHLMCESTWWPWPFDLWIGSRVTRVMGIHRVPSHFRCRVTQTGGQTEPVLIL